MQVSLFWYCNVGQNFFSVYPILNKLGDDSSNITITKQQHVKFYFYIS